MPPKSKLEDLKRQRASKRRSFTLLSNKTEEIVKKSKTDKPSPDQLETIEAAVPKLQETLTLLEQLDLEIEEVLMETDREAAEKDQDEATELVLRNCLRITRAKKLLEPDTKTSTRTPTSKSKEPSSKLPKLTLPKFNGKLTDWLPFWERFVVEIDKNSQLSDVNRFDYLYGLLEGDALEAVRDLIPSSANYKTLKDTLLENYGKDRKIIQAHVLRLLHLDKPQLNGQSLRSFFNSVMTDIRSLANLKVDVNVAAPILVPIIEDKLPSKVRGNIADIDRENFYKLDTFLNAFKRQVERYETESVNDDVQFSKGSTVSTIGGLASCCVISGSSAQNETPRTFQKHCVYCKGAHNAVECKHVTDYEKRQQIVKQERLCYNCLKKHCLKDCPSTRSCRNCRRRHHTSLCKSPGNSSSKDAVQKDTPVTTKDTKDASRNSTKVHGMSVSADGINRVQSGSVLLKTAVADVSATGADCSEVGTILFDEGATRSFITKDLAEKLQLVPVGKERIQLATFGGKPADVRTYDSVTFNVHTITSDKIAISALVVPVISAPVKNYVNSSLLGLSYLRKLRFAHPISNEDSFEITVLIGADFYWDFMENNVIKGHGPTAVESKLGYLLSGPIFDGKDTRVNTTQILHVATSTVEEEAKMSQYWDLETLGIKEDSTDPKPMDYTSYCETHLSHTEKGYQAKLPWQLEHPPLPTNYDVTAKITRKMVQKLSPDLRYAIDDIS